MGFTTEQAALFQQLYAEVTAATDQTKLVQLVDRMLDLLVDSGEAVVKNVGVSRVVPHKDNRGGAMMEAHKVYAKGAKIMNVGFSLGRCDPKRAVAFQVKPGDDRDVKKFVELANQSPNFATFDSEAVEACSVGCGHLNQFLAAIVAECEVPSEFVDHPDLFGAQRGSKLDKHYLCKIQGKELQSTVDIGLKWTFIPYKFEKNFPKLPHVIQKALNTEHHIAEGETWDEQLRSLAVGIKEAFENPKTIVDYSKIARAVLASQPPRKQDVPHQLEFCKRWGGGASQRFSLDICHLPLCADDQLVRRRRSDFRRPQ